MIDENLVRLRAHRNNIHRYRRLLATRLTDLERSYLERRLKEEESAMDALSAQTLPFTLPAGRPRSKLLPKDEEHLDSLTAYCNGPSASY
jgi:hypothetical protein